MHTVIRCGQMIDGVSDDAVSDAVVAIDDGGRIDYAGPAAGYQQPPDATVYDLPGGTVLPGLIDVHVHIMQNGYLMQHLERGKIPPPFARSALIGYTNAQISLRAGFTTLRDLNSPGYTDIELRDIIAERGLDASRLVTCGQGLCITGGHMDRMILPHHVEVGGRVGVSDTPDGFRAAVRQHVKRGVDFIKVNANMRFYQDGTIHFREEMTFDELEAACSEAHKFGMHVAAHTAGGPPTDDAILAGVDTIEHARWLTDRSIELLLEKDRYWVPTFLTCDKHISEGPEGFGATQEQYDHLKLAMEATYESFERAKAAGVKIASGTDCGFICDHGDNAGEIVLFVEAGYTPMQAIQAATSVNAELLGMSDRIGALQPGMLADVLVVDGNPLERIGLLREPECIKYVFKEGRRAYAA